MVIKNKAGQNKEYKLYWQNLNDTIKYEEPSKGYGSGAGILGAGGHVNDTAQVDNGYTAELMVQLDSLGYDVNTIAVPASMVIFDPDGFVHPMNSWDHTMGAFFKTWWGSEWGSSFRYIKLDKISDVADGQSAIPKIFSLEQNYPNPFNPSTTIEFGLPVRSNVTLEVYDIIGRVVATLYKGEMGAGYQHITFNASKLASGIYIYRLSATSLDGSEKESFVSVKKLVLLK
jgi:hypothetical protein